MQLQLQDFTTLVRNMAASVQGSARNLIDLTTGSVLRAILEANASIALWLQWLIVQVLAQTRAATSAGPDLDSWVADFSLQRLPGQAALTTVVFSRITLGLAASIPVGTQVKTADGSQIFAVLADATQASYDAATSSYAVASSTQTIALTVQAAIVGIVGNVQPGVISLLATAIPGIDAVTNPNQAAGGLDAETDAALRARFANFIDSRSRATPVAIAFAVDSLQQGLQHVISENVDPSGAVRLGFFTVTIDDGSGAPPAALLASVSAAVDLVRPVGTLFAVQAATVTLANITMAITADAVDKPAAQRAVIAAITAYVATLPIGGALPLSRLAAIAYAVSRAITNVSFLAINGGGDLVPTATAIVRIDSVTVN